MLPNVQGFKGSNDFKGTIYKGFTAGKDFNGFKGFHKNICFRSVVILKLFSSAKPFSFVEATLFLIYSNFYF